MRDDHTVLPGGTDRHPWQLGKTDRKTKWKIKKETNSLWGAGICVRHSTKAGGGTSSQGRPHTRKAGIWGLSKIDAYSEHQRIPPSPAALQQANKYRVKNNSVMLATYRTVGDKFLLKHRAEGKIQSQEGSKHWEITSGKRDHNVNLRNHYKGMRLLGNKIILFPCCVCGYINLYIEILSRKGFVLLYSN